MRRFWLLTLVAALLLGCEGRVITIESYVSPPLGGWGCNIWFQPAPRDLRIRSLKIEVFEWHTRSDVALLREECIGEEELASYDVEAIDDPESMLEWFSGRGYIARGVPTELSTRLRIQGYHADGCETHSSVCAANLETLSGTTFTGQEQLAFSFVCFLPIEYCRNNSFECDRNGNLWSACLTGQGLETFL